MSQRVYSTDLGKLCPQCQHAIDQCQCQSIQADRLLGDGNVRILRETKGRKGKGVTLITGLAMNADELKQLAKELKQRCSTGGSVKGGTIEIQGDQRTLIHALLEQKGIKAKLAGG